LRKIGNSIGSKGRENCGYCRKLEKEVKVGLVYYAREKRQKIMQRLRDL